MFKAIFFSHFKQLPKNATFSIGKFSTCAWGCLRKWIDNNLLTIHSPRKKSWFNQKRKIEIFHQHTLHVNRNFAALVVSCMCMWCGLKNKFVFLNARKSQRITFACVPVHVIQTVWKLLTQLFLQNYFLFDLVAKLVTEKNKHSVLNSSSTTFFVCQ